jgi:hypothetical protein
MSDEKASSFGSKAGEGLGCGFMLLALATAFAIFIWAISGFPQFWK